MPTGVGIQCANRSDSELLICHENIDGSAFLKTFLLFINPTASALDSRDSGPTPSGMGPLHENDVFRVALRFGMKTGSNAEFLEDPLRGYDDFLFVPAVISPIHAGF